MTAPALCCATIVACASLATSCPPATADSLIEPMRFTVHQECEGSGCAVYILAEGTIVPSTPDSFVAVLSRLKHLPPVYFNSLGGDLGAGMALGRAIRRSGLDTFVGGPYQEVDRLFSPYKTLVSQGACYSACAYAFLGGVARELGEEGRLGVHQFRGVDGDAGEDATQVTVATVANYIDDMGVNRRLLDMASLTSAGQLYVLTREEAQLLNVDNTIPPRAPWKLEADHEGRLLLSARQRQARRDGIVHLAIARNGPEFRASVGYQIRQQFRTPAEMAQLFAGPSEFVLRIEGRTFQLAPLGGWVATVKGYSIALAMPSVAVDAIAKASSFDLDVQWANAVRDVKPSATFGTEGFRNGAAALARQ